MLANKQQKLCEYFYHINQYVDNLISKRGQKSNALVQSALQNAKSRRI